MSINFCDFIWGFVWSNVNIRHVLLKEKGKANDNPDSFYLKKKRKVNGNPTRRPPARLIANYKVFKVSHQAFSKACRVRGDAPRKSLAECEAEPHEKISRKNQNLST